MQRDTITIQRPFHIIQPHKTQVQSSVPPLRIVHHGNLIVVNTKTNDKLIYRWIRQI